MKTHLLVTKDGLEFRITQNEAEKISELLDANESISLDGNRITNADQPRIRKIALAPELYLQLADSVFNEKTPRWIYLHSWMIEGIRKFKESGKAVHMRLLDYVGEQVGWDFEESKKFLLDDWESLQEFNIPTPQSRLDRDRNAPFETYNSTKGYCGKCVNGWLPGNDGMVTCKCNPSNEKLKKPSF